MDDLLVEDAMVKGVVTASGERIKGKKVILTTGTFLGGVIHIGKPLVSRYATYLEVPSFRE